MQQFYIREYSEKDIHDILALFVISFKKEASEEWFRWKYQHSPFGSKGYVAVVGDLVVAFYGGLRLQFSFNDRRL